MNEVEFSDWLASKVESFDELFIKDIRPITETKTVPRWWHVRENIRKCSEGLAYKKSRSVFERWSGGWIGHVQTGPFSPHSSAEHDFDRFSAIFPEIK